MINHLAHPCDKPLNTESVAFQLDITSHNFSQVFHSIHISHFQGIIKALLISMVYKDLVNSTEMIFKGFFKAILTFQGIFKAKKASSV